MTEIQYLLTKLAEEACEVSQAALKCAHFGLTNVYPDESGTTRDQMIGEIHDFLAVMEMLIEHKTLLSAYFYDAERIAAKKEKVKKWMEYSRRVGMLTPEVEIIRAQLDHITVLKGRRDEQILLAWREIDRLKRALNEKGGADGGQSQKEKAQQKESGG